MSNAKRILFVTPHYPPSPSVGTQRMIRFIKNLARRGWDVFVLTQKEEYYPLQSIITENGIPQERVHVIRTAKWDPFRLWGTMKNILRGGKKSSSDTNRPTRDASNNSNNGKRKSTPARPQNRSVLFRIIDFITRMMQYPYRENGWMWSVAWHTWRIVRKENIPVVFASSPPHSPYLPLNVLRSVMGFRYVVDFRDPWARSQWSRETRTLYEKVARRLDIHFEQRTLRRADAIVFNNEVLFEEYQRSYPSYHLEQKSVVLTNGFDPDVGDETVIFGERHTRGEPDIVIIHAGTLYKKRDPRNIFSALLTLREEMPTEVQRLRFKFLGHVTPDLHYLFDFVKENELEQQVEFLPPRPYQQALQEMMNADWLLILQPVTRIQVPAKFFDYLLMPRPIWGVVEPDSISERLIQQLHVGRVSYNDDPESILQFFRHVLSEKQSRFAPNQENLEQFMVPNIVARLENVLLNTHHHEEPVLES